MLARNVTCVKKLYVHENEIIEAHEVKYLGDFIHENGRPNSTINQRIKRGYKIVAQIFALLRDLLVGNLRVEIGLALRQAWLVNEILFNSEVWYSVSAKQVANLMDIDKYLLRSIVNAHSKVPLEHLYLELSVLPLSYVLSVRRMIYLETILKKNDTEITKQIHSSQKPNPLSGDWCNLVAEDFNKIGLHISDEHIAQLN